MTQPIAVVLCNLGGPDSLAAVQPFLYNLFSDPAILDPPLGGVTRKPLARWIAKRRAPEAAKGYAALGGKSPLLENTRQQAQALARALAADGDFSVHVCMRYWHPRAAEVVAALQRSACAHVVLLPLYPQYSHTTTGSSRDEFLRVCAQAHYTPRIDIVREWHDEPHYLDAIADSLRRELARFPDPDPARTDVLFSAHGLPRKLVTAGDPYERQIRATYEALRSRLGWPHTTLCYQSRVGPLEWLGPYIEDVIRDKAARGAKQLLVYPIAFVSDHSETLYELGQTYAAVAREHGIAHYRVCPALNDDPGLIEALRRQVLGAIGAGASAPARTVLGAAAPP